MEIPDDWEQELMLHSWKMMKLTQHQHIYFEDFCRSIYIFPNGLEVNCQISYEIEIIVNIEFSGMVERIIDGWDCKKKDCKSDDTCKYTLSLKSKSGVMIRKDIEVLLWDLYSLGS